jgi:hypothetical protein
VRDLRYLQGASPPLPWWLGGKALRLSDNASHSRRSPVGRGDDVFGSGGADAAAYLDPLNAGNLYNLSKEPGGMGGEVKSAR